MKAIIYAGIGLFSVAAIYGMADYYNTGKTGTLDKLYKEEDSRGQNQKNETSSFKPQAERTADIKTEYKAPEKKSIPLNNIRKLKQPKRRIRLEDFSRGKIEMPVELPLPAEKIKPEPLKKEDLKIPETITMNLPAAGKTSLEKESPRKISLDMFSRAPLKKRMEIKTGKTGKYN